MASEKTAEDENEKKPKSKPPRSKKAKCCRCLFWTGSILTALAAIFLGLFWRVIFYDVIIPEHILESIGQDGIQLFFSHDRDSDGQLSLEEYEALYLLLKGHGTNTSELTQNIVYDQGFELGDEVVTVEAKFQPLLLDTMTREKQYTLTWDPLIGLRKWTNVNHKEMNFAVRHFKAFMPSPYYMDHPGEVYTVVDQEMGFFDRLHGGDLSSNRYVPPRIEGSTVIVHRLLAMFHPRPFIMMRFEPRGSMACVRAYNNEYVDIYYRIHAEFQLNEVPYHPFWFTPAQFTGNLIVSRDLKKILNFTMYVPADKRLNVDMEWLEGPGNMVVDIGYMPEMSLATTAPSEHPQGEPRKHIIKPRHVDTSNMVWTEEISKEEALSNLEVRFYAFKQDLKEDSTQPRMAKIAKTFLDNYRFPVMMMLATPDGKIVHEVNANEFLDKEYSILETGFSDPSVVHYVNFLKEGINQAQQLQTQT